MMTMTTETVRTELNAMVARINAGTTTPRLEDAMIARLRFLQRTAAAKAHVSPQHLAIERQCNMLLAHFARLADGE